MIKKIISIRSVAKFVDLTAKGDVEFKKINLIYGENGKGKSTLATIFRSLGINDNSYVLAKKTIGVEDPQKIEISFKDGKVAIFENEKWDSVNEDIIVFDENYINTSVYSGNYVSPENKQNLFYLVVGQNSVKKAIEIETIDNEIRAVQTTIKEKSDLIQQHIKNDITLDEYIHLVEDIEIDKKISDVERKIRSIGQSQEIKNMNELNTIDLPNINFDQIRNLLRKTVENIDETAINKFYKYIETVKVDEDWIHKGFDHIKNDLCPFCQQPISGLEAINIYRQFFNEELKNLKLNINDAKKEFPRSFSESDLFKVSGKFSENLTLLEFWNNHFQNRIGLENYNQKIESTRKVILDLINQHIEKKILSILDAVEFSNELNETIEKWKDLNNGIAKYNQEVEEINKKVAVIKGQIENISIQNLKDEKGKLENLKERYSVNVKKLIDDLTNLQSRHDQLIQQKSVLQRELKTETEETFDKYKTQINNVLCQKFGLDFKITKPKTTFSGRKTNTNYCLEINGEIIPLGKSDTNDRPSFRTTLSSGEKSSLACSAPHILDKS